MTYTPPDLGIAERRNFFEIPLTTVSTLSGLEEATSPTVDDVNTRRYAIYTYSVGESGSAAAATSTIVNAINTGNGPFALYQEQDTVNNIAWIAEAAPGSSQGDPVWRVRRTISTTGALSTTSITWADGDSNFDNVATSPLSGLTYS